MIRHIVMWKLAAQDPEGKAAAFDAIVGALGPLPSVIPELLHLSLGSDLGELEPNWDVVLIADYKSTADLAAYQVHPAHVEAAAIVRQHTVERATVDFEL
ncbi:Dabb family protein [Galbitalea soli]|uniref:Dabb family protein n=1 Tax=Galbitalea soli TaxID=1268042 RepID=A0A7C9TQL0_9MICO|nr:Dabb family protein [Galbitalea soli]NEM91001.1 Dabb family protein [Galbitalea soli]NYJ29688.1 hypothetical protein [Galbitalea soli]